MKHTLHPLTQHNIYSGVGCFAYSTFHVQYVFNACLKVVWRFEQRAFYIGSLSQTHFGMRRGAKMNPALIEPKQVALHFKFKRYLQT